MFEIGRLVVKIAGRDARKIGVVVDVLDKRHVMVDGQVRRRKVNVSHLEPLDKSVEISKGAGSQDVAKILNELGIEVVGKKNSHGSATRQPKKRASKEKATKKE